MAKYLYRFLLLLVIAVAFYLGIFFVFNKLTFKGRPLIYALNSDLIIEGGNSYTRYRDYNKEDKYDVIVMGSSHAYRGFDPRIFEKQNLSMFNLGSSSQSLMDTEVLLKHSVNINNFDYLILELFPLSFVEDGYESVAFLAANHDNDKIVNKMLRKRCDIKSLNLWTQRLFRSFEDGPIYKTNDYINNGYCENTDSLEVIPHHKTAVRFNPKIKNEKAFLSIIDYIKTNDLNAVFVSHPIPKESDSLLFAEFDHYIDSITASKKVEYLNYSRKLNLDSKNHFFDHAHLNQAGVEIFNEQLLQDLKRLNLIPKH